MADIDSEFDKIIDPFAGEGDLLRCLDSHKPTCGYDIDPGMCVTHSWIQNDSLGGIARDDHALCLTNPPYLANNTAKRFKREAAYKWFDSHPHLYDLYLIGLGNCLHAFNNVIAIVPETFLQTKMYRDRLILVNILEDNPFDDTEFPTLIACWGRDNDLSNDFRVIKNDTELESWNTLHGYIPALCAADLTVKFNRKDGQLGLIGVDDTKTARGIRFCAAELIGEEEIKHSSRLRTRIYVDRSDISSLIEECNEILHVLRDQTGDIILSPFKSNNHFGIRRRRLDYNIAKRIIHQAVDNLDNHRTHIIHPAE